MPEVIVIGGGLAGMAAAAALGSAGYRVTLFESRSFLGGRATSFPLPPSESQSQSTTHKLAGPLIDNCQHILLRCCVNLLDFYERFDVLDRIRFHQELYFVEPGGRVSILQGRLLPAPLHFGVSFLRLKFLSPSDKLSVARALSSLRRERIHRQDLDRITMLDWLKEKRQSPRAIERFWRQILVSAVNEELDSMAARHGFQVFWLGFLARSNSYEMGIPAVPLGELYASDSWKKLRNVTVRLRSPVQQVRLEGKAVDSVQVNGEWQKADYYICALPFERLPGVIPELKLDLARFGHSPITGIHLWFDRPITELPHAVLLDRTVQWLFNKAEGCYVQLVVSASRSLLGMSRSQIIELALRELQEFFPPVRSVKLEKAHVIKEVRATFSAVPGLELSRPPAETEAWNLFLAGDWTRSGWPATMEGAVRSGYLAAEAVSRAAGNPRTFLLPEVG